MREWLKEKRIENKFTQQNMADLLGITVQFYSYIEKGQRYEDLPLSIAFKLSEILKMPIGEIQKNENLSKIEQ